MASLLLGRNPARASGRDLVRWCGLFGVPAGTARVALHRMTNAGELIRRGDGGYELTGTLARRQQEQESSLRAGRTRWNGSWRVAIAGGVARPAGVRSEVRAALTRARFAEWREGVWTRPANLPDLVEDSRCAWLDAKPDDDPVELAEALFAPRAWSRHARQLVEELERATVHMREDPECALAPAFLAGAATLRHIRADPLLPVELLPDAWPGSALRIEYRAYQREFTAIARVWFRTG